VKFVSFHTHTTYSYGDGFGTVREHVQRVKDLGMSALALSEHGNVNSHAALERECRTAGIKPIFGLEAYFAPPNERLKFHITLFAKSEEGYLNLNKIVTQSYLDAYQYPTVTWENLVKNSKEIVAFSGCSDSLISCTLLGGKSLGEKRLDFSEKDYQRTRQRIEQFQKLFGENFYLEVQRFPDLARTCVLNPAFAQLSTDTGAQLIASADVHYPYETDNKIQTVLHAARRSGSVALNEQQWEYDILLTYPKSDNQIQINLENTGLTEYEAYCAIDNTRILAEECNVELPKAKPLRFKGNTDSRSELKEQIRSGLRNRVRYRSDIKDRMGEYKERIRQEFTVIADKDFCDYFLVVADLVQWAKKQGVTVGPGRGSAAGSLICYLLGITEIDPLHSVFDRMVFERFIDPNRADMPDIDLDFDDSQRYRIAERAREIYGAENVANVANHIKYRGRKALQDVARAHGLGLKTFDAIGQKCAIRVETDERVDDSIQDTIESFQNDAAIATLVDEFGSIINQAIMLEGNQHSMGIHAGGFVISSEPIPEVCAIYTKQKGSGRNRETAQVIPYEKRDAEYLGMLKMDFLGLTTCGMLGLCLKWSGVSLEKLYSMFYSEHSSGNNDTHDAILRHFRADDVIGIFQYEGGTTRQVVRDVAPDNFDELAACGALSRPGPYYGGQTADYIAVKRGEKEWQRIHPGFDKHVEWTYGQIVYQEQIMWILRDLAGFDTAHVLKVRKIIGKKLGEFQFASLWEEFRDGCISNGVTEDAARTVWGGITTAAGYAFNTAHAYSYALVAWWQMWFKINHPAVFYAATLAKNGDGKDDLPRRITLLQDAIAHDIEVLSIDPNCSTETWRPDTSFWKAVRPGFCQIDGIGEATAADIIAARSGWWDWADIAKVKGIGAKTIQRMQTFAAADDPFGIYKTENQLGVFREQMRSGAFGIFGLPSAGWFYESNNLPDSDQYAAFVGLVKNVVFRDEVETIRTRTGKPVHQILSELDFSDKTRKATIFAYDEHGEVALRLSRFVYPSVEYKLAAIKPDYHIIVGYGRTFKDRPNCIQLKELWVLEPD
jgi:DNA polymerase-3 subunit alpha